MVTFINYMDFHKTTFWLPGIDFWITSKSVFFLTFMTKSFFWKLLMHNCSYQNNSKHFNQVVFSFLNQSKLTKKAKSQSKVYAKNHTINAKVFEVKFVDAQLIIPKHWENNFEQTVIIWTCNSTHYTHVMV